MYVVSIAGPSDVGKTALVERLVSRLAAEHDVATVKHCHHAPELDTEGTDTARHREAGATTAVGIGDAEWIATGDERSLRGTLDDLASEHDYAIVEGFSASRLPTVALGGAGADGAVVGDSEYEKEHNGDVLLEAPTAADVDLDVLIDALHDTEPYESLASLVARVKRSPDTDRAGAIATFTGRVRAKDSADDAPTEHLAFEKYEGVADETLAALREDLLARDGVYDVALHHRTGVVRAGEDIVFVVILAGHRTEAFGAVEDGINRLKEEVPLFKKEVTVDDSFWAHER